MYYNPGGHTHVTQLATEPETPITQEIQITEVMISDRTVRCDLFSKWR